MNSKPAPEVFDDAHGLQFPYLHERRSPANVPAFGLGLPAEVSRSITLDASTWSSIP